MARITDGGRVPRIKGTAMLAAVKALRSADGQRVRALLPPELHKYLEATRVLASSWYPEAEMLAINRALAQIMRDTIPGPLETVYERMGRLVARIDLTTHYSGLVVSWNRESMVRQMAACWKQYHDTGQIEGTVTGDRARFELTGYEYPSIELCGIQRGWFGEYLDVAAGSKTHVEEVRCQNLGDPSCIWDVTWGAA
jgi:predicted hydrocarbon binding protein